MDPAFRAYLAENLVTMADISRRYQVSRATASIWKRQLEAAGRPWPKPVYTGHGDGNVNQTALYWWPEIQAHLARFKRPGRRLARLYRAGQQPDQSRTPHLGGPMQLMNRYRVVYSTDRTGCFTEFSAADDEAAWKYADEHGARIVSLSQVQIRVGADKHRQLKREMTACAPAQPVGWVVLTNDVKDGDPQWQPDWDGVVHTDQERAETELAACRAAGWQTILGVVYEQGGPVVGYLVDGRTWHPSDVTIIRAGQSEQAARDD